MAGVVLWVMSSMIEVEPTTLQSQTNGMGVELFGTRNQCNNKLSELNQAVNNSKSCQTADDCVLLMDGNRTFSKCFISVQSEELELVVAKFEEFKHHCRDSYITGCGHMTAYPTCQDGVCSSEHIGRASQRSGQELIEHTLKTINEDLQIEDDRGDG